MRGINLIVSEIQKLVNILILEHHYYTNNNHTFARMNSEETIEITD